MWLWNWFNCYLSGRHDYGMWCEPGTIFLRCVHCGKRSPGWAVDARAGAATKQARARRVDAPRAARAPRVIAFDRSGAR